MTKQSRQAVTSEVRASLARSGLTQAELANRISMSAATLSHRLNMHSAFDTDELTEIAEALDTEPRALLGGAA